MQPSLNIDRLVQSSTGRPFQLFNAQPSDWVGQWPTDRSGDVFVSEMPGNCDGSIFGYWLGDKTLTCPGVIPAIQAHMDDHDVVGVHVICDFPDDAHSSLKSDLAKQKRDAVTNKLLAVREGTRVKIKCDQARLGGDKFPGREGVVQRANGIADEFWYVLLKPTSRAAERVALFSLDDLIVLTTTDELPTLPPMSGSDFANQLNKNESLLFAGASYVLLPRQVAGLKDGWAVNATYPNGSHKSFGDHHPLTRTLALQVAAHDAMDWWLNRRGQQSQVTFR